MAEVLVTGGAGFIGSHLVDRLLAEGFRVVCVDNFDPFYDADIKRANLANATNHPDFTLVEADIRDGPAMEGVFRAHRFDAVYHLAARAGIRPSLKTPRDYADVNVTATTALLDLGRRFECGPFIFASSSSVYGNNPKVPFHESDPIEHPISPYAATKRSGELMCQVFSHVYGCPITCLRVFTAYGPRCRPDLAIARFTRMIHAGESVPMFGDGSMQRDFTHVSDIVDGLVRAAHRCEGFHVYNLGNAKPVVLLDMIEMIAAGLGRSANILRRPQPPGDVDVTYADVTRARTEIGYEPAMVFADGIRDYIHWFTRQRPSGS